MVTQEPSGHTTGRPHHLNPEEKEENDREYNFIKMIETLKKAMKNSLKETKEKTNKNLEEINIFLNETQEN